jgi:glycosyltransferase involved in cell wall biosynthesis
VKRGSGLLGRAWAVFRAQGLRYVIEKIVLRIFPFIRARPSALGYDDALAVDWRVPHPAIAEPRLVTLGSRLVVGWVMPPPGANSGGHQNIFRFIKVLEDAGHEVRVYLYSAIDPHSPAEVTALISRSSSYESVNASIEYYPTDGIPSDVDALFATTWDTAYRSYRDESRARRFYFVQDYEPMFYATSSETQLAENTYRFGFTGITAGKWLAQKLSNDFGMSASAYDFGSDAGQYSYLNTDVRRSVFFYARPETPRRGFELGVMALDLFSRARPDVGIITAGQDLRSFRLPFRFENLGNVQVNKLNDVYNRCAAGLVLSLSNLSLLPLELLSAGVIPVVNDAPNNRLVSDNPFIEYTPPVPRALADRLISIVDRDDQAAHAAEAAASVRSTDWSISARQFLDAFDGGMRG